MSEELLRPIREVHHNLLRRMESVSNPTEILSDVTNFIHNARQAGTDADDVQDRNYLQSVLTFWGNWTFNQSGRYPETDLYPPSKPSQGGGDPPRLRPPSAMSFAESPLPAINNVGMGQPFIMVNVVSPTNGSRHTTGAAVTLRALGMNLQVGWRVFFVLQRDNNTALRVLDGGYTPEMSHVSSAWDVGLPYALDDVGTYHFGLALCITPEAVQTLENAFAAGEFLESVPVGGIGFFHLSTIIVRQES